jgi:hypothetical protein
LASIRLCVIGLKVFFQPELVGMKELFSITISSFIRKVEYGIRSFYELSVLKGLWLRTDVERMNAFVPINRTHQDIGERKKVRSYMAGIKKDFSLVPGVTGNVQFMYNLYDPDRTSPYFNRFNVRFGFPLKKKTPQ